jgi:phosphoglycerate dehydrogenase-like enzyme
MFGAEQFAQMKQGAVFVNTARGGLVDGDALLSALESGRLFGAGLDVTEPEPLPADHPLLHRDDVVVTPHVASGTAESKVRIFRAAFEQVVQGLSGRRPDHLVNPAVWDVRTWSGHGGGRG